MLLKSYRGKIRFAARRLFICLCAAVLAAVSIISPNLSFSTSAEEGAPQKMLHVTTKGNGTFSQFTYKLTAGKEYTVRFQIAFKAGSTDNIKIKLGRGNYYSESLAAEEFTLDTSSGIQTGIFKFTPAASDGYDIGFNSTGATEYYISNIEAYASDDESKTDILQKSLEKNGLSAFRAAKAGTFSDTVKTINNITLGLEDYNAELFAVPADKMLHIKNTAGNITFSQWTGKLEANGKYTVSFRYSIVTGSLGDSIKCAVGNGNFWNGTVQTVDSFTASADGYRGASFTFTAPEASGYDIGFKLTGAAELYIYGFTVYKSSDAEKTDLFERTLAKNGVNCFRKAMGDAFTNEKPKIDNCSLTVMNYSEELFIKPTVKMLHITTDKAKINLSQQLPGGLSKNTAYSFSVKYKIISGSFEFKVFNGGFWGAKNYSVSVGESDSGYKERTFSYTGDAGPIIGLAISESAELYLTDWSFYRTDDPEKTNLLTAQTSADSLSGWKTGSNGSVTEFTGTVFSNSGYTVKLEEKDEQLFKYIEPAAKEHKMLYIDGTPKVKYKHFGQNVRLESGKRYIISFKAKYLKGDIGNAFNLGVMNNWFGKTYFIDNGKGDKALPKTVIDGWNAYEYSFTAPSTADYAIGFTFVLTCKFYLADFSVYEEADGEKTNLLPAESITADLSGWRSDKIKDLSDKTEFTQEDNAYTVALLPYDESLFKLDTSHKMLHINDYGGDAFLGQNVSLKKGVSYTVAFQYRFLKDDIGSGVHIAVQPMLGSGKYRAYHSTQLSDSRAFAIQQVRDDYVTYTFTLEDREYEGGSYTVNDEDTYGIGLHFTRSTELYLADFVLYETADPEKTNLLPVKNYGNGLYGWRSDWSTAAGDSVSFTDNGNKYTVDLLPYLASAFEEPEETVGPHKMIYFQNFSDYHVVCQRVRLKAGSTYRFAISLSSTVQARAMLQHNGARNNVFGNLKPIEDPVVNGDWFTEIFEFTVPEYVGETKVNTNEMYLGIQFPAATSAYIFDAKLWDISDPAAKNLFKNTNFDKGLDDWIITWGAWFIDGRQGTGLKEFELDGSFKLEVMDYNEEKFIPYDSDVRMNDGVWWKNSDITEVEKRGTGTVTGYLRDNAGNAVSGAELVLKSEANSYKGITDKNGAFIFKNIPNAFYELYVTDGSGNEHFADFGYTVEIGCVITVNITLDSSYAVSTEVSLARGYIGGTLYTADKKTVADKRIYIRNLGAVKTDKNGSFIFPALEPGGYELYCYDDYGNEYPLRNVQVEENTSTTLKLKYAPTAVKNGIDFVYILIICGGIICVINISAGIILIMKKRRNTP